MSEDQKHEAGARLAKRILKVLEDPRAKLSTIGRLGALLFDYDDADVATIRGRSNQDFEPEEVAPMLLQGIEAMNDPRILSVEGTEDGGVQIDLYNGGVLFLTVQ